MEHPPPDGDAQPASTRSMNLTGRNLLLTWIPGILIFLATMDSWAGEGFEVASRHSIHLNKNSTPVVGNGEVGCLLESSSSRSSFFMGSIHGEHWNCSPAGVDLPARRVEILKIQMDIQPVDTTIPSLPGFLAGAVYKVDENVITNRFQTSDRVLSASFTLDPTQNLFVISGKSSFPVNLNLVTIIPDPDTAETYLFSASSSVSEKNASYALTQDLPRMESFGIAVHASGGTIQSSTLERGIRLKIGESQEWLILLRVISLQDNPPLLPEALAEARAMAATSEAALTSKRIGWWKDFWNRSVLDMQGSTHLGATQLERIMVWLQHGMVTHTRGRFPPGDCGFGEQRNGGRPWHSTLWPLYRGWILTHHADQIHCLGYPLLFPEQGENHPSSSQAFLPTECGPDAVPSASTEALGEALLEVGLISDQYPWNETGRLFSTIPLIQSLPGFKESHPEGASAVYPFLFRNANRAMEILSTSGALSHLDPTLIPHLCMAVKGALEAAAEIEIDGPSRVQWMACLKSIRTHQGKGKDWPDINEISHLPDTLPGIDQIDGFLEWFSTQQMAPEGVLLNASGGRSLLKTGWTLGKLVDLLVREKEGVYQLLPGFTTDGTWSLQWENISLEDGCVVPALTLKNGILDSFLLRPSRNGPIRFVLPSNWASAKVAAIGPSQEALVVKTDQGRIAEFAAEAGQDYLIGPVW